MHIYKRAKYPRYFSVKDSGKNYARERSRCFVQDFWEVFFKLMDTLVIKRHQLEMAMHFGFFGFIQICNLCALDFPNCKLYVEYAHFRFLKLQIFRFVYYRIQDSLTKLISTDGALRLPTTYDPSIHPIHPPIQFHPTQI